jgi:hypothetical protein
MSQVHVLIDRNPGSKCSVAGDGATGARQELIFGCDIQTHSREIGLKIGESRLGRLTYRGIVQEVTLLCILDLPDDITKLGCDALVPRSDYDRAYTRRYHSRDCHGEKNRQETFASLVRLIPSGAIL